MIKSQKSKAWGSIWLRCLAAKFLRAADGKRGAIRWLVLVLGALVLQSPFSGGLFAQTLTHRYSFTLNANGSVGTATNQMAMPFDFTQTNVFFQLIYP